MSDGEDGHRTSIPQPEWNETVLDRIQRDEETCKGLRVVDKDREFHDCISYHNETKDNDVSGTTQSTSNDAEYFGRLGVAVGSNTKVRTLEFCGDDQTKPFAIAGHTAFFDGLKRNSSIQRLRIRNCVLSESALCDLFNVLGNDDSNISPALEMIYFERCTAGNGMALHALARALRRCTNLAELNFGEMDVRQHLQPLVSGMRGCHSLAALTLGSSGGLLDRSNCEALAPLLQDTRNSIIAIQLWVNNDNYGVTRILTGALANNRSVTSLSLYGHVGMRLGGWRAFSKLLCDTSSIESTYLSNHTLYYLSLFSEWTMGAGNAGPMERSRAPDNSLVPDNISILLRLNSRMVDKKQIAVQKIFLFHPRLDMSSLFEWELKCLPLAIDWLNRVGPLLLRGTFDPRDRSRSAEQELYKRRLDVIYQFVRALPEALVSSPNGAKKRKLL